MKRSTCCALSLLGLTFVIVIAGCGGGGEAPAIRVSVSANTSSVQAGGTAQFTGTVTNDTANKGVTWVVSCSPTPCGTVSPTATASGAATTYTAPTTPPASDLTVTVTATSVADTSASGSATITVTVPAIAVSVSADTGTVQPGGIAHFTATVTNDPANKGVTWTVSCSTAQCGTVSPTATASGVATTYTALATQPINDLQVTFTATSVSNSSVFNSGTITIPGISVSVTQSASSVPAGGTAQFTATVTNDMANKGVTWVVSCCPAPCGTVSPTATASGAATTYTAPTTPPASDLTVTVTATSVTNTSASGTASVTVPAITVAVTPGSALIPVNVSQQFTATDGDDPAKEGHTWTLTQNGTACSPGCGIVAPTSTASGEATTYTAPATVPANAMVTLNGTLASDSTKSGSATITLTVGTVKLVPDSLSFGHVRTGSSSSPQVVMLTNTANTTLTITSITVGAAEFRQTNACGTSVAAGMPCTISVTFSPVRAGPINTNLSISDSSPDTPQTVSLSGKGTTQAGRSYGPL